MICGARGGLPHRPSCNAGCGARRGRLWAGRQRGVHHLSAHRRVRMMNPAGSGSSACASARVPTGADATQSSSCWARPTGRGCSWWSCCAQRTPGGSWSSTDGPGAALRWLVRLGFEYPAWAARPSARRQGRRSPRSRRSRTLLCRNLGRELVHLLFVLRGPDSPVGRWPGRAETLRALCSRGDRTAWYNLEPGMRGVFLSDTWRTVADQTWEKRRA